MNEPYDIFVEVDEPYAARVDADDLRQVAVATLEHCAIPEAVLTIVITGDEEVRDLNRTYRGIDAPTDVLSFASQDPAPAPNQESGRLSDIQSAPDINEPDTREPGATAAFVLPPDLAENASHYLGDIVIAFPYASHQAVRFDTTISAELRLLVVHGTLHLLGYDHDSPNAEAEMWRKQDAILARFGEQGRSPRAYDE